MDVTTFDAGYRRRVLDDELDALFPHLPAVLIDGPKAVGKTATALRRSAGVRRLDIERDASILRADPLVIADDPSPLLIDEWHRVPSVFDAVRRLVDADRRGGRFLLTGSAPTTQTHSGAGRITAMRMRPLTLPERGVEQPTVSLAALASGERAVSGRTELGLKGYVAEILASGFPGLRGLDERVLHRELDGYLDRIVDHDVAELNFTVRRPATLRAWMRAYAAATGTAAAWEKIRDAATSGTSDKPAKTTTIPYVELLTSLRILDPVEAWMPTFNHLNSLTQGPKHFLADPALAARLVRRTAAQLVAGQAPDTIVPRDGGFLGGLFEGLAALSVRVFAQPIDARVFHLRTDGGRHEVDLIVECADGIIGFEVKLGGAIDDADVRHLRWLRDTIGDDCIDVAVLNTGPEAFRRPDGIAVIPLALLGA